MQRSLYDHHNAYISFYIGNIDSHMNIGGATPILPILMFVIVRENREIFEYTTRRTPTSKYLFAKIHSQLN